MKQVIIMDKPAIKKFAIWARNKLIADTKYRAGLVGVTETAVAEPLPQSTETVQFFDVGLPQPYRIEGEAVNQRQRFVAELNKETAKQGSYTAAYQTVVDKVAYTWFNRLIAVRYMEVNDLLPSRTRVLSSADGRAEPQIVTSPFDAVLDYSPAEQQQIVNLKNDNKLDEAFRLLFLKQCAALGDCLPRLFEQVDDYMPLLLALSFTDKDGVVYHLVHDIPEEDWLEHNADLDSEQELDTNSVQIVGWLYQDYNTEDNNLVYDGSMSKSRIPKELLPAATTIYTPDWVTRYMVQNSLGRLWCEGHPDFVRPAEWKYYLDEVEQTPATQEKLLNIRKEYATLNPADIKCIDPCSGSGHILVHMFDVLMEIYRSAGYSDRDAVRSIIENNLYGLDVSDRAVQLSYFAVMMKACHYDIRFLTRKDENGKPNVPQAQVYAMKESNDLNKTQCEDAINTFVSATDKEAMRYLLGALKDAKEYGSILKLKPYDYEGLLRKWNDAEKSGNPTLSYYQIKEQITGYLQAAMVLCQRYDVVVTNPPYLAASRFSSALDTYVKKQYPDEKVDLSAVMFKKASTDFVKQNGFISFITTTSWMFLSSFEKFRTNMLKTMSIDSLVDFGTELFDGKVGHLSIAAWVSRNTAIDNKMTSIRLVEYCYSRRVEKEPNFFESKNRYVSEQKMFSLIPGSPVAYWVTKNWYSIFCAPSLYNFTISDGQNKTGDNAKFVREFWEVKNTTVGKEKKWLFYAKGGGYRKWYGNITEVVNWSEEARKFYKKDRICRIIPEYLWYKIGITWSLISNNPSFRFLPSDATFDVGGSSVFLKDDDDMYFVLALLNCKVFASVQKIVNPTLNIQVKDIRVMPVIKTSENKVYSLSANCLSLSKDDWDSFETSWDFKKHPLLSGQWSVDGDQNSDHCTLTTAHSTLLSDHYAAWESECNKRFHDLKANEEELNRIFIGIYGLQDELTPEVEDKDVTVRRADLGRDIRSLISYAVGCIFGRYSLDKPGLAYAGGDWNPDQYHTFLPDADNVIPITDEEYFPDDLTGLFVAWVKKVFGTDSLEDNLAFIAKALGTKGTSPRAVIRNYFLNGFYADHVKIYQKRPIYWLYDSGKQNGFKALIYMHRYNADTSGTVRAEYLYKMEQVYESEIARMDDAIAHGASREVAQATKRKEKLVKQLKECKDYDDRLGHIALARIPIDLDDGVKVNYEKVQTGADGKKQAILAKI